jgi:hypothetical protein
LSDLNGWLRQRDCRALPFVKAAISIHLAKLRSADVLRYDTTGKQTRYWLKHKGEMKGLLKTLERVIDVSAKLD